MNTQQSTGERQVSQSESARTQGHTDETNASHYVKHHGYKFEDFAKCGETTEFSGIRVLEASGCGESKDFENFRELNGSGWIIEAGSAARLSDGTVLYEGRM